MAGLRVQAGAGASASAPDAGQPRQQRPQQPRERRPYSAYRLEADLTAALQKAEAAESAAQGKSAMCAA